MRITSDRRYAGCMPVITQPGGRASAPRDLSLLQAFLNSDDIEGGHDELTDPRVLGAWLLRQGLVRNIVRLTRGDLGHAVRTREALRTLLRRRERATKASRHALNRLATGTELNVVFSARGPIDLLPRSDGLGEAIARLLAIAYRSSIDGTWARLKICGNDSCQWAYYDPSCN